MARHGIWPSDPAHLPPNADRPSSVIGGAKMLLSHNRYEMRRSSAATSDGQSGPWPGEKTPYFTAKTGHMARHGIWPSDPISLRWAGWVKPCHGLARWRAACVLAGGLGRKAARSPATAVWLAGGVPRSP